MFHNKTPKVFCSTFGVHYKWMPLLIIYACVYPHGCLAPEPLRLPSCTQHSEVTLISPLCIFLCSSKQFIRFLRELFCYRSETNLTLQVVLELIPLRLFRVERERVLAFCLSAALWAALPPLPRATGAHLTPRMASARVARTPPASGLCHTLHQ